MAVAEKIAHITPAEIQARPLKTWAKSAGAASYAKNKPMAARSPAAVASKAPSFLMPELGTATRYNAKQMPETAITNGANAM